MTHKLSSACAELILSYHLLSQQIFFTPTGTCHVIALGLCGFLCFVWVVLFVFLFCVVFALVLCVSVLVL